MPVYAIAIQIRRPQAIANSTSDLLINRTSSAILYPLLRLQQAPSSPSAILPIA
jgi:hypothetical protein